MLYKKIVNLLTANTLLVFYIVDDFKYNFFLLIILAHLIRPILMCLLDRKSSLNIKIVRKNSLKMYLRPVTLI
jgi:hypothetical protein